MGHNDHIDVEMIERVDEMLAQGYFEAGTIEYGLARKVAEEGEAGLSEKQAYVYRTRVLPILSKPINDQERLDAALEEDWRADQS